MRTPRNVSKFRKFILVIALFLLSSSFNSAEAATSAILTATPSPTTASVNVGYLISTTTSTVALTASNGSGNPSGILSVNSGTWTLTAGTNTSVSGATVNSSTPGTITVTGGSTTGNFSLHLNAGEPGGTYTATFTAGAVVSTFVVTVSDPYVIASATALPTTSSVSYGYLTSTTTSQFSLTRSGATGANPSKTLSVSGGTWTLTAETNTTISGSTVNSSTPQSVTLVGSTGNFRLALNAGSLPGTYTATFGSPTLATYVVTVNAAPITNSVITGVNVPVTGATPVSSVTADTQFTGSITWSGSPSTFPAGTIETATITLTPTSGFTLTGVSANHFSVAGATTVTNALNSGVVIAVFPATNQMYEVASAIASPDSQTVNTGYLSMPTTTISLTRSGNSGGNPSVPVSVSGGTWTITSGSNTAISSTPVTSGSPQSVTLTNGSGNFTLSFNTGASAGTYTATIGSPILATFVVHVGDVVVSNPVISGVTVPVTGAIPVSTVSGTAEYTGTVTWSTGTGAFPASTIETATITLTPNSGYTLTGVGANFFTVSGATTVNNSLNSGVVTAVFPVTSANYAVSAAVATPSTATVNFGYSASTTSSSISLTRSGGGGVAPTTIVSVDGGTWTLVAETNTALSAATVTNISPQTVTLNGATGNFALILNAGSAVGTYTATIGSGLATFVVTVDAVTISNSTISGVTIPVTGATPVSVITPDSQFTGTVTWSTGSGAFPAATIETATITLSPTSNYTLNGIGANHFSVAGATSVTNGAGSGVITAVFPATTSNYAIVSATATPATSSVSYGYSAQTTQVDLTRSGSTGSDPSLTISVNGGTWTLTAETSTTTTGSSVTISSSQDVTLTAANGTFSLSLNPGSGVGTYTATIGSALATFVVTVNAMIVTHSVISGVSVPVLGETPVSVISVDSQFTGSVSWSTGAGAFPASTIETATITLTPATGYTLSGVSADHFTVSGATSVTNPINTGIITAVFPATSAPAPTTITQASITLTAPVTGATPASTILATSQFTGTVSWVPTDSPFDSGTVYTATITVTPETGYTLSGVSADFFTVSGANSSTHGAGSGVITAIFPATAATPPSVITDSAIVGIVLPVTGATPVSSISSYQYNGVISWSGSPATFPASTIETATITLTANSGFTLTGVGADFFTVSGASSVTNLSNSGVVTAVFPVTTASYSVASALSNPDSATVTFGYVSNPSTTVTLSRSGGALPDATTLVSVSGGAWTLGSDTNTSLSHTLLTSASSEMVTLNNSSGAFTLSFNSGNNVGTYTATIGSPTLATYVVNVLPATISNAAISGVVAPVHGEVPVSTITSNSQFSGTVTWSGSPSTFDSATIYTATITLSPTSNYTVNGVGINFFTVDSATSVSNSADSGIISATFPATATLITITDSSVVGVTAPVTGATPVTIITPSSQFTGTVVWSGSPASFPAATIETATITLTPTSGYTLIGVTANYFTIAGTTFVTHASNSGVITAVFSATAAAPTPTPTPTPTSTVTPTPTPVAVASVTPTPTVTSTAIPSVSPKPSVSPTPSSTPTPSVSPIPSATPTPTPTIVSSASPLEVPVLSSEAKTLSFSVPADNGTLIPVTVVIPQGLVGVNGSVRITPVTNAESIAAGNVTMKIEVIDVFGAVIPQLIEPMTMRFSTALGQFTVARSNDGFTWTPIPLITGPTLPAGFIDGYYIDANGGVVILTNHLTEFGLKSLQKNPLTLISSVTTLGVGKSSSISITGGSGTGAARYISSTPTICTVTLSGVITGLKAGLCTITATKGGDAVYLHADVSTSLSITGQPGAILSVYGGLSIKKVFINLGTAYANKSIALQAKAVTSNKYLTVKSLKLDAMGRAVILAKVPAKAMVRVLVNSKSVASIRSAQ